MKQGRDEVLARPTTQAGIAGATRGRDYAHLESVEALEEAATVLARRWRLGIVSLLAQGSHRYNALMRALPGVTPKMLTQQLRSMEEEGLVVRFEHAGAAKHTEYALTPTGERFAPIVQALSDWVHEHWRRPVSPSARDRVVADQQRGAGALGNRARAD